MTPQNTGGINLQDILNNLPGGLTAIVSVVAILACGFLFVKYNIAVLGWLGKIG